MKLYNLKSVIISSMARSVVDLGKIRELKAAISAYSNSSEEAVESFHQQALSLLSEFETKLSALESIREQKAAALSRCEMRQSHDEKVSCASEERAYQKACERCQRCEALIAQARSIISEFENRAVSYRTTCQNLSSRAATGLERVESMIHHYSTDTVPNTDSCSGNNAPVVSGNQEPQKGVDSPDTDSATHITGDEQIASVLPKGSKVDPVRIDFGAMGHKFDNLPNIVEPDKATLHAAAIGILGLLAAGGLALGARELLLQQKTDEIFEKQYGISRTQLLIGTGSKKQKEYVSAYNNIYRGLQQEIKEIKKQELSDKITNSRNRIKLLSSEKEKRMHHIEALHDAKIHLENYENQLTALNNGKKVRLRSLEKTTIGGLSNDSLTYMLDGMGNSKRFITSCNLIAESGAKFLYDHGTHYQFAINEEHFVDVAHDGSWVTHIFADKSEGGNIDFVPKVEFETSFTDFGYEYKPFEYKDEGFRYSYKKYYVADDGSATVLGYNSKIGLEANAGAGINVSPHNIEGGVSAGVSIAEGGIKIGDLSAPQLSKGKYAQTEFGIKGEAGLSASIGVGKYKSEDGTSMLGVKAGPFSGGISVGKYTIPVRTFNDILRNRLQ